MKNPRVSIIVNNFNYGRFVEQAVSSALRQTYANCEVIVVDDGSTDESRAILERYTARALIVFQENGGQAAAFNTGFARCTGELILFLDADDLLHPHAIAELVKHWDESFSKLQFPLEIIDSQGEANGLSMPSNRLSEGDVVSRLLAVGRYVTSPTSGNLYPRWFLEDVLPMPVSDWKQGNDSYLNTLAGFAGKIGALQQPLGSYRVHKENMSGIVRERRINREQVYKLLQHGRRQQTLVNATAALIGLPVNVHGLERHWLQLKLSLAHQKLALGGARFNGDSLFSTCCRFVKSALADGDVSWYRKLQLSAWAICSTCLPEALAEKVLLYGFEIAPVSKFKRLMRRSGTQSAPPRQFADGPALAARS